MKNLFVAMMALCVMTTAAVMFSSCEGHSESEYLYTVSAVAPSGDPQDPVLNNYAVFAYPKIEEKINEVAKMKIEPGSAYFSMYGTRSKCDKNAMAAINAAMDEIEATEGYGQGFRELGGVKVRLMWRNTDVQPNRDEEVNARTFK